MQSKIQNEATHQKTQSAATNYKRAESQFIDALSEAEKFQIYIQRGHTSLSQYITTELKISENIAYALVGIIRKSKEVPELKEKLQSGAITLSNARRVASVISPENKSEWLEKAETLTNRQLEREIAKARPELSVQERVTYVSGDRVRMEIGLYERDMLKLRQAQDLLCQKLKRPVSLEETITSITQDYLKRNDPVEKAKQYKVKTDPTKTPPKKVGKLVTLPVTHAQTPQREPIPAQLKHQINLRDHRRCAHTTPEGKRCNQRRWIEIHHKIPVSHGGKNTLENLITLCSSHHRFWHQSLAKIDDDTTQHQMLEECS